MSNYKHRPKINPKIIFNNVENNTSNALIIGENNSDIIEILISKNVKFDEIVEKNEIKILKSLEEFEDDKFEVIIFNLELSNFHNIQLIISKLIQKSNYSIVRFRNNDHGRKKTKKSIINNIIKQENIKVFKKVFGRKNRISESILFKPFAYYTVYFITKNTYAVNFELSLVEKIKKLMFLANNIQLKRSNIWKIKN